jgi:hypothetical protein
VTKELILERGLKLAGSNTLTIVNKIASDKGTNPRKGIETKEANFKARYKRMEANFISREKIILGEGKVYLISIFSLEGHWPEFESEAEKILDSVQIIL